MRIHSWFSLAIAGLALLVPVGRGTAAPAADIPDSSSARSLLAGTIFAGVRQAAAARPRAIVEPESGDSIYFRPEVEGSSLYLLFSRERDGGMGKAAAGSYIIKRSMSDGRFQQAKIFLQNDPGFFIRLFPWGDRTLMDAYVLGEPLLQGVIVPQPFDRLLTAPFSEVRRLTEGAVDWQLLLPSERTPGDARVETLVKTIRPRLARLGDVEDGAMDSSGRFVFIRDGRLQPGKGGFNCSGFSKFVVDGFYRPITSHLMDIEALKTRNLETRKNPLGARYEESRDPYFGLDWARNLARALASARSGEPLPPAEFADVRDVELFPYRPDIGYPIGSIQTVLYLLWKRDPGALYLGTVNTEAADGAPVRAYHHLAVFFPYADAAGLFRLAVMERNVETSTASLQRRFPKEFVHLVKIDAEGDFGLP